MIRRGEVKTYQQAAAAMMGRAGIVLTDQQKQEIEIADLGLGEFLTTGLGLITYINTDRYCGKDLMLWPNQTCPEHRHPPITPDMNPEPPVPPQGDPGKMETFRCRWGVVYLYVEGAGDKDQITAKIPEGSKDYYTVFHEIVLHPGDQYTIPPNTWHWFQGGPEGDRKSVV